MIGNFSLFLASELHIKVVRDVFCLACLSGHLVFDKLLISCPLDAEVAVMSLLRSTNVFRLLLV